MSVATLETHTWNIEVSGIFGKVCVCHITDPTTAL